MLSVTSISVLRRVQEHFLTMPAPISNAFRFVQNYCIAYEIKRINDDCQAYNYCNTVCIVERFHHSLCVNNLITFGTEHKNKSLSENASDFKKMSSDDEPQLQLEIQLNGLSEGDILLMGNKEGTNVFDWPYDLPLPDLVIFLCLPTAVRLQRSKPSNTLQKSKIFNDSSEGMVDVKVNVCGIDIAPLTSFAC